MTAVMVCLLFGGLSSSSASPEEQIILVKPFQINAAEPLDFLKKGIDQMLATRLTIPGHARVVFYSDTTNAATLDADYIIEGTLLVFGDQVSTDVKMLSAKSGATELSISQTGNQKGDVIKHIDLFTDKARKQVLGTSDTAAAPVTPVPVAANEPPPVQSMENKGNLSQPPSAETIWRGPFVSKSIDSFQVVDIDNDGKNEILTLAEDTVEIYRRENDRLIRLGETKIEGIDLNCLFLAAIDLDGDGLEEICITATTRDHTRATSFIYRVDNFKLVQLMGPMNYLFNVVDTATGPILLGQKTQGTSSQILKTPVVELRLSPDGQGLAPGGRSFPFADNVFGIAFGDFMGNGTEMIALLGLNGTISLCSPAGEKLYRSSDEYGGTAAYIAYKGMRYTKDDGFGLDRIFLQQRLFSAKLDNSGKTGLIVVNNRDSAKKILSSTRIYGKSRIDQLMWNELGLDVYKQGQGITGYISDYCIGDTNSDGGRELVFCVISSESMVTQKRSQIISMPMP